MVPELVADDRGRVTLSTDLRKRHGNRFFAVSMPDGIHLVPIPSGPMKGLGTKGAADFKRILEHETERETDEEYKTIHGGKPPRKR